MAKPRKAPTSTETIAGFTAEQWKHHMDADEDWTERLESPSEQNVREAIAALDHADATVRALACNLVYAIGVTALAGQASHVVDRLAALAANDGNAKVRNRARVVHEGLAGELERTAIRKEFPWLAAYTADALPKAVAALDDPRAGVRLQVYMWFANGDAIPSTIAKAAADKLAPLVERETDDLTRRAAQLALAHVHTKLR